MSAYDIGTYIGVAIVLIAISAEVRRWMKK